MKQGTTVYLYELAWILPSIAIPVGMLAALAGHRLRRGHPPAERRGPRRSARGSTETAPFDRPAWCRPGPGSYEVRMLAQIWAFTPERDPGAGGLDGDLRGHQQGRRPRALHSGAPTST